MNFFKTFLAALLAIVVANIVVCMFAVMVLAGMVLALGQGPAATVRDGSILRIDLSVPISDSPSSTPVIEFGPDGVNYGRSMTLYDAVSAIDYASVDSRIEGIYIDVQSDMLDLASLEELRAAIARFSESGKFVVGYNDIYSQSGYYLSSVADRVYMNPEGMFSWHGASSPVMFYKGLLDKLGVEVEVFRHGTFKAAVEPFVQSRMSDENRLQMNRMLSTVWEVVLDEVGRSRGIDTADLDRYADELMIKSADDALAYGLVDDLLYRDQVYAVLGRLADGGGYDDYGDDITLSDTIADIGMAIPSDSLATDMAAGGDIASLSASEQPRFISLDSYIRSTSGVVSSGSSNKIAVIYADGEIMDGKSGMGVVGDLSLSSQLARARMNDGVKAVVLRVNSPGGSAIASEEIWRAIEVLRSEKPVVVSMGSTAASGGYYISCGADAIFADRMTVTGSIGVFGLLIHAEDGLEDKLGITVDVAKTNASADLGMPFRGITDRERMFMQYGVDKVYETFVGRVAAGRNLRYEQVDEIAEGRIWSGVDAASIGLVDGFGGLTDAITYAADRAGVAGDYTVVHVTESPNALSALLGAFTEVSEARTRSQMGDMFRSYNSLRNILDRSGSVQAVMPYTVDIE